MKFGEILDGPLRNGISPSTDGDVEARVLVLSAITGAKFDVNANKVGRFKAPPPVQYRVSSSDLLICRGNGNRALVGRGFFPGEDRADVVFPDTIIAARLTQAKINRSYVEYLWNSPLVRRQIEPRARTTNGTFKINQEILREIVLLLPSLAEQATVAARLEALDGLRSLRLAAIGTLDELAWSIFAEIFADSSYWPASTLGNLASIVSGVTKGRKLGAKAAREVPYLAVVNVQDRRLDLSSVKTIKATEAEIARYKLQAGDLLLTEGGDPDKLGRGVLWRDEIAECIHQNHIFRVRMDEGSQVDPLYLGWFTASGTAKRYFLKSAKQTTGIASINMSQLQALPVPVPPLESQREFARRVEVVEQLKAKQQVQLQQLNDLFTALQDDAFRDSL